MNSPPPPVHASAPEPIVSPAPPAPIKTPSKPSSTKRKPGRPKINKSEEIKIDDRGIIDMPSNNGNVVEMVYCTPIFKSIFGILKAYEVVEIFIVFDKDSVMLVSDTLKSKSVKLTINVEKINLYYCKERTIICVKTEYLNNIFTGLVKDNHKITFILKDETWGDSDKLYISIHDKEFENDNQYTVEMTKRKDIGVIEEPSPDSRVLGFTLSTKHLKNKVSEMSKFSEIMNIQKDGISPLQITIDGVRAIQYDSIYSDGEKIKLFSAVEEDDIEHVSVSLSALKPISKLTICSEVDISIYRNYPKIKFRMEFDRKDCGNICHLEIFLETITNADEN